jgi:ATP-dependent DNA helicase RecG
MTLASTAVADPLAKPVEELREVGPARAAQLRKIGVTSLGDLINYFPRDYQHESEERPIGLLSDGQIGIARGEVTAVNYIAGRGRPRFEATLADEQNRLCLVFFHGAYLRTKVHPGLILRVRGPVRYFRGLPQMVNPKWEAVVAEAPRVADAKFRAVYPATEKLSSETIERIIGANLTEALAGIRDWCPGGILGKRKLVSLRQAYRDIHQPGDRNQARAARRRLVYDELISMQLALGLNRRFMQPGSAPMMRIDRNLDRRIRARFPFELTGAQEKAIWQIVADLQSGRPMKRLLQGDVGSGKTAVALYAMLVTVANKMQGALLAPTEVLAEQHYLVLSRLLRDSQVKIELVTSRTKQKSRDGLAERIAAGEVHIAVGTQALLQKSIEFANLGLIVVDEQHRLGVLQRAYLTCKARSPHYLVMTATPIPRTLALSYFADFDLSTLDEGPPGRQAVGTRWLRGSQSAQAYGTVRQEIAAGRQAYIVVPRVEDDDLSESKSVAKHVRTLSSGALSDVKLAPLHGQMPTEIKQQTMAAFRDGKIDALVATTMIEVGIDVPNATVMLIEGADRFGLSQLHQLRGRVGRGEHPSQCILLADPVTSGAAARLEALVSTRSGFEIADMDLRLRGPGEFFGTRQHGLPEFKLAEVENEFELLRLAKQDADQLLGGDPGLIKRENAGIRAMIRRQFGVSMGLAAFG